MTLLLIIIILNLYNIYIGTKALKHIYEIGKKVN